ncbi:FAD-dependent oxidoreductase [Yanghanlia caeni]|uniref:FAD-dependent oxidoreductase n=1 Tax=Yanghanlia caeni TaxID=3064283 RepID=A0ABU1D2D8_9BURK|nr:FAD-dependent oxidoreductase [Alcaligenaceae bacterium LG-2]
MGDIDYQTLRLPYRPLAPDAPTHHPVIVVGAGPVGMSMALDLARHGHPVVVLDDDDTLSVGSRAICFAKRTLDVWDRLGVGERMVQKGISWNVGRVFFREEEVWNFDLLPEAGHRRPAFINLQQYYCEGYLYEQCEAEPLIEIRWKHRVTALDEHTSGPVRVTVETPDGSYTATADWLIACDGARSPLRKMLGQEAHGQIFRDRFLIADVKLQADFPAERWFWFDPPFHPNQSVLLHSQPDNVWRIDFQLGWDADPAEESKPEKVLPRIRALLGQDVDVQIEWVSVYTFACERMDSFRHGRVFFAGDAAHRVSPFGARGANSGVQDIDNLTWKLDLVMRGAAPDSLLDTYGEEREFAADENILNSTRSTDFITPKSEISLMFRNAVLRLAKHHDFARRLVNSGRLSVATFYTESSLNTPDTDAFNPALPVGAVAPDGPVTQDGQTVWWLSQLGGSFCVVFFCDEKLPDPDLLSQLVNPGSQSIPLRCILIVPPALEGDITAGTEYVVDQDSVLASRYDVRSGACYLIRPDQHIAARWRNPGIDDIRRALHTATCTKEVSSCHN